MRLRPVLLACVTLPLLAACGDDHDGSTPDTSSPTDSSNDTGSYQPCGAEGVACDPAQAQPTGFVCAPDRAGVGACRVACQPGLVGECPGRDCLTSPAGSFCVARNCAGFFSEDCGAGARCLRDGDASVCAPVGTAERGANCQGHGDCRAGLLCVGGLCAAPVCTLDGQVPCPEAGQRCLVPDDPQAPSDVGFECETSCTPYTTDDTCGDGAWCRPESATTGRCVDIEPGAAALGGACSVDTDCGARMGCVRGRCQILCAGDAPPGNGWCTAELPKCLGRDGARSYCLQMCVWPTSSCALADQRCSPRELHGTDFDLCMFAPGAWDRPWPLAINDPCEDDEEDMLCGPGAVCYSGPYSASGGGLYCSPICRERYGAMDVLQQHPDCPDHHSCDGVQPDVEGAASRGWGMCLWDGTF